MLAASLRRLLLLILVVGTLQGSANAESREDERRAAIRRDRAIPILRYMNTSTDPCEDFYEFTCGRYAYYSPTDSNIHLLKSLREWHEIIKTELLKSDDDEATTPIDKKVKAFYKSCLKSSASPGVDQMLQLVNEFGAMPALEGDTWHENDFDWMQTAAKIAFKYGINIFTDLDVAHELSNGTVNSLYITSTYFNYPKSVYLSEADTTILQALRSRYVLSLQGLLGLEEAVAEQTATEILELEKSLAKGLYDRRRGLSLNERSPKSSIDEAYQRYSKDFDLKQFLNMTLGTIPNVDIRIEHDYLQNLVEVLRATPKRVVANYIFFNLIRSFVYRRTLVWRPEDMCIAHTKLIFYKNLENMMYRRYVEKEAKEAFDQMWLDIKAAFQKVLESPKLSWVTETTRQHAVDKLNAMKVIISSYDNHNFEQELGQLNLSDVDYLGNLQAIFSSRANISRAIDYAVPQTPEPGEFAMSTPIYIEIFNSVLVPVELLQSTFAWSDIFPNAYNFAVLGSLLAHEMLHGYDGGGRSFDAEGTEHHGWWQETSENGFAARSKCFSDQYQRYIYNDQPLPAMANQDENIADNGGIRVAYAAYRNWYEKAVAAKQPNVAELESLEGLNYNADQLFFISFGHLYCANNSPLVRSVMYDDDSHVPTQFRVIGSLSNMEEFSQAFNCPRGSGMNPVEKCEIY